MNLLRVIQSYPYFFSVFLSLGVLLLAALWLPGASSRRLIVRLGLIMIPNSMYSALTGEYWAPRRLGGWAVGVEDVLFSFCAGAMACVPVLFLLGGRLVLPQWCVANSRRVLKIFVVVIGLFLVQMRMGISPMTTLIFTQSAAAVLLLVLQPHLWPMSLAGGAGYTLIYCVLARICFWIWPGFLSSWSSAAPWGNLWFGVPLGEIVWAASFGAFWPLFTAFVFDLRMAAPIPAGETIRIGKQAA